MVQQYINVLQWQFNMHDQYEAELPSFYKAISYASTESIRLDNTGYQ